jgi:hypothetical protein
MASYIAAIDILDDQLFPLVKAADITNSDEWFNAFSLEQGVPIESIKSDPLPWQCKRAIVLWVCCELCRRSVGTNLTINANGSQTDWYKKKLDEYEKELTKACGACTTSVIMGYNSSLDDTGESITTFERA